ncbi:MAG: mechanosensitive ion channel family protein, partial [Myxococcales bacterium]|nr:mechanosensitive ion channel family protein [Myxococcales bacterium]
VERSGEVLVVYVGAAPIVQLSANDAHAAGDPSLEVHADSVAAQLRKAIKAEKERTALANRILSISLVVVFGLVVIYLLRRIGDLAERGNHWVEDNPHRIPAIRVRTLTLLTPAAFRSAVALAISTAKWVGQFAIVYLWLLAALGLFEATRGYTDKLNGYIVGPFVSLTSRIATMLPITVVVLIAGLVLAIVLRVIGLFFESVKSGATTIEWLPPDLAQPTSILTRIGLVLTTLVFAAPVLTGHPDGALARGGLVGLATLGLASVPLVTAATVGALVVYGRRYRVGEYVRIGSTSGRVSEIGLLDVSVEDDEGSLTRVPHLLALLRPVQLLGTAPRVAIRVAVDRGRATSALRARLARKIVAVGTEPRVEVEEVGRDDVFMSLSVLSEDLDAKSRLHLLALDVVDNPETSSMPPPDADDKPPTP